MTPEQVQTVQDTWKSVLPIAGKAADLFYDKLFLMDPGLRTLFPDDLAEQKKKLMSMIGRIVTALRDPNAAVPMIQDLGRRHVGYGVRKEDYTVVGGALLWTLEQGLGSAWTTEVKDSWVAAYTLMSGVMIDAASTRG